MSKAIWQQHKITKKDRSEANNQKPFVIWITGLSGSGKSTLASELEMFLFNMGHRSYLLDGDNLRHGLNKDLGFDLNDRNENIRRAGELSKILVDAGLIVITAFISPLINERRLVREMFESAEFVEVFLNVPLDICESRDPKGLYKKARSGLIKNFTGIDSPYENPETPEILIEWSNTSVNQELDQIVSYLKTNEYLK